jgi:protein transport protein SEC61 subunit alpha
LLHKSPFTELKGNYIYERQTGADPFFYLRGILLAGRGSLMELGISPILTANYLLHLAVGLKFLYLDLSLEEDVKLYKQADKCIILILVLGLLLTIGEALTYIWSGQYGSIEELGYFNTFAILC